jgi:hypothetical protein
MIFFPQFKAQYQKEVQEISSTNNILNSYNILNLVILEVSINIFLSELSYYDCLQSVSSCHLASIWKCVYTMSYIHRCCNLYTNWRPKNKFAITQFDLLIYVCKNFNSWKLCCITLEALWISPKWCYNLFVWHVILNFFNWSIAKEKRGLYYRLVANYYLLIKSYKDGFCLLGLWSTNNIV